MFVIYDRAHSYNGGTPGAMTRDGVTERTVAVNAEGPFRERILSQGFEFFSFSGQLNRNIRRENSKFLEAQEADCPVVAVSLHFNNTPEERCENCGGFRHAASACPVCGAMSKTVWKFGHKGIIHRTSEYSRILFECICEEVEKILPFSKRRDPIVVPDPKFPSGSWPNNLIWPGNIFRPSCLFELGFACDLEFAAWIKDPVNQRAYGMQVAEGIVAWHKAMKESGVPFSDWRF